MLCHNDVNPVRFKETLGTWNCEFPSFSFFLPWDAIDRWIQSLLLMERDASAPETVLQTPSSTSACDARP